MIFTHASRIQLHHTDAAGIVFYSRLFDLAFEAFSAFLQHVGVSVAFIIRDSAFLMPFVHAEVDFLRPLGVGDEVIFQMQVEQIKSSSYTVAYTVLSAGEVAARMKTVHVTIDKETEKKIPLPEKLRLALEPYLVESCS
jgi:1,4-dihydroxy-2-naphthoyl-CoA hydrolase